MINKILILNPPSPDNSYINRDLMGGMGVHNSRGRGLRAKILFKIKNTTVHIPMMQLVNAATILKQKGYDLQVIDAVNTGKELDYVLNRAVKFRPDMVIMGVSSSCFRYERDEVAKRLKQKIKGVKIIAVGDMITEMPNELLPWFDIAIMGEIEQSIVQICEGRRYEEIPSIIWKEGKKVRKSSGGKQFISSAELEKIPFPDWSLFPYNSYSYYPMLQKSPVALIQASRGCPYGCGYCPYPANQGRQWRSRSAENVFREMKQDVERFGFKGIFFRDPLFTADQDRVERLCDLIIKSGLKVKFVFETRPELLTNPGLIRKLANAGCKTINFGVEDIHPEILKNISRLPLPTDQILNTIHECEKNNIRTTCFFVLGLPGSTKKTMDETIRFSRQLFSSQTEYKVATPFPGTLLYDMAKKNKWITKEGFDNLGGYSASMRTSDEFDEEYLEKLTEKSTVNFYFSSRYLLRYFLRGDFITTAYHLIKAKFRGDV